MLIPSSGGKGGMFGKCMRPNSFPPAAEKNKQGHDAKEVPARKTFLLCNGPNHPKEHCGHGHYKGDKNKQILCSQ